MSGTRLPVAKGRDARSRADSHGLRNALDLQDGLKVYPRTMSSYKISEVAERTGFATSTLRYYEDIGVLSATERTQAGYRLYDDRAVERLRFVARAKQLGLSLDEITELATLWDDDACGPVQHRMRELVATKSAQVAEQISEMTEFAVQLAQVAGRLSDAPLDGPCDDSCACGPVQAVTFGRVAVAADVPIACTLAPDKIGDRLSEWQAVFDDVVDRTATPEGIRLTFRSTPAATIAGLAEQEQQCCAFFAFTVGIGGGFVTLEITAPPDARAILDDMFGVPS